jgi:hypothetical protein
MGREKEVGEGGGEQEQLELEEPSCKAGRHPGYLACHVLCTKAHLAPCSL